MAESLRDAKNLVARRMQAELEERLENIGYLSLDGDASCLDADFTAAELRAIADAMDKLAETPEFKAWKSSKERYFFFFNPRRFMMKDSLIAGIGGEDIGGGGGGGGGGGLLGGVIGGGGTSIGGDPGLMIRAMGGIEAALAAYTGMAANLDTFHSLLVTSGQRALTQQEEAQFVQLDMKIAHRFINFFCHKFNAENNLANVALASLGASATAYNNLNGYPASNAINGDRTGGSQGTAAWVAASAGCPNWLEVNLGQPRNVKRITIYSIQDNTQYPVDPDLNNMMLFSNYGVRSFDIMAHDGVASWLPVASISSNPFVKRVVDINPCLTSLVRIVINAAGPVDNWPRIAEVGIYI